MMDDNYKYLRYTNKQRMHDTKRKKYLKLLENYRKKSGILEIEKKLCDYNLKTVNFNNFKKYIDGRNSMNTELLKKYEKKIFRQYNWYSYINKQRSEDKLINKIKEKYLEKNKKKELVIIMGDWNSGHQMKNFISTPNIGIKNKLLEKIKIYNIDEYNTSKINYKTRKETENIMLPDKNNKLRRIHSVLTYKMENQRMGCINRDKNSVNNMKIITDYYMKNKERPIEWQRNTKRVQPQIKKIKNVDTSNGSQLKQVHLYPKKKKQVEEKKLQQKNKTTSKDKKKIEKKLKNDKETI